MSRARGASAPRPGDDLIADADLEFDTTRLIAAPPEAVWPWLVQVGKQRAGWYLPRSIERLLPRGRRAIRHLDPAFQSLDVGDEIPDYGGKRAHLTVASIDPPRALVYRDQRGSAHFSWSISLEPEGAGTRVHLRFRGSIASTGLKRRAIVSGGHVFDRLTGEAMLSGLAERVEPGER